MLEKWIQLLIWAKSVGVISDSRALFTMQGDSELKSSAWKGLVKKAQPDSTYNHQK